MSTKTFGGNQDHLPSGHHSDHHDCGAESLTDSCPPCDCHRLFSRRNFLAGVAGTALVAAAGPFATGAWAKDAPVNLAAVATPSSLYTSGDTKLSALNDGATPANSLDYSSGCYGTWPRRDTQWVQYDWSKPVTTDRIDVYWWVDGREIGAPASCRVLYWNGKEFVPVPNPRGLGVTLNQFNTTTFDPVKTDKLRLEIVSDGQHSTGILEWKVYNSGPIPVLPPVADAGLDRVVVLGGETYLTGKAVWLVPGAANRVQWTKVSGPGRVAFANAAARETTATFSTPGDYVLKLTARDGKEQAVSTVNVHAEAAPPKDRLDVVYTTKYSIDSPFWNARAKTLIASWIPHCIEYCERTDLERGQGGIDNFIEAAKALRGEAHGRHKGYVFSNAWVHQTVESMCIALMVDPQGDPDIIAAQAKMRETLDKWIPIILAAQEPDGYLQTAYTLADRKRWAERWSPEHRGDHEGYVAGYFIESAINHYTLTDGKDLRLYNAAKKLADCWVANIGPGKKEWFDGHQEMEQALVRFGRFVNDMEGNGRGDAYVKLAKFLLDSRRGGHEYDQSHLPPGRQYEAVGHAVRAAYFYSAMADIAAETGDHDYQSAVMSLWDNMVNKKYYVTGGIGSGETSEGFGPNYSLRNNAYCESCSSCGLIFFQYKLNLAYHDAKYADLYEETMYNALLGGLDLEGKNFAYTNPLINTLRTPWHVCPCCVGNIPRTLLMVPTWAYVKGKNGVYVNMFVGSRINVGNIAGTDLEMVQKTNYPWNGSVEITVNPKEAKTFSVYVRVPNRTTSKLYTATPAVSGAKRFAVNGEVVTPRMEKGYAVITREWKAGDRIQVEFPMEVQRIKADTRIKDDVGRVALRYGPLVYNVEKADQPDIDRPLSAAPLKTEWRPDLLGGVMTITGKWQDGSPMVAIPNYARMNRIEREPAENAGGDSSVNYAPGATTSSATGGSSNSNRRFRRPPVQSIVWMKDQA
ncbi:MAG TPA: beta-L-arabinofuranosidase domain-containing protein [Terriglobales bacterium]|nr:beta-L-arabinofuranosidase domain-containing protein [Terriglobales bacterium]